MFTENAEKVEKLVDHLFRQKASEIVAVLTGIFGFENFDLAEDVVQETLVKALQRWPYTGIPQNPAGWILQVAKNQALDILRRKAVFRDKEARIAQALDERMQPADYGIGTTFPDEQLTLLFTCCHPAFTQEMQVTLMLKTLCALSVREISRAFLTQESTIAQRLVRARKRIQEQNIRFEFPEPKEIAPRLDTVLQVLYVMFNEGYAVTEGENLIRGELCNEAIRLCSLLVQSPEGNLPKTHALLSLFLFQSARLNTRTDQDGNLLQLPEQDRSLWDRQAIDQAFSHLELSSQGDEFTRYHVEAGIASLHAIAPSYGETKWKEILNLYDSLLEIDASPIVQLNRCVALSMVEGPQAAIDQLDDLRRDAVLASYYLFPATLAELHLKLGDKRKAADFYRMTLPLTRTLPERAFIERRLRECEIA